MSNTKQGIGGALPFYALEVMNRITRVEIPADGRAMVKQGLIHEWQCGSDGEVSPFVRLYLDETLKRR